MTFVFFNLCVMLLFEHKKDLQSYKLRGKIKYTLIYVTYMWLHICNDEVEI